MVTFRLAGIVLAMMLASSAGADTITTLQFGEFEDWSFVSWGSERDARSTATGGRAIGVRHREDPYVPGGWASSALSIFLPNNALWVPSSQGGIDEVYLGVDCHYDGGTDYVYDTQILRLAVEQDGKVFLSSSSRYSTAKFFRSWIRCSVGACSAESFGEFNRLATSSSNVIDFSMHPDFSEEGKPIRLGFSSHGINLGRYGQSWSFDNAAFEVTPIPSPSSLILLLSGVAGFCAGRVLRRE